MDDKCKNCTEKCPQADRVHQAATGRMYATNEFINLQKKIDSGELVEVVRCRNCEHWRRPWLEGQTLGKCQLGKTMITEPDHFCSHGERRTDHV